MWKNWCAGGTYDGGSVALLAAAAGFKSRSRDGYCGQNRDGEKLAMMGKYVDEIYVAYTAERRRQVTPDLRWWW